MASVKFFGLLRIKTGVSEMQVQGKTIKQALCDINNKKPDLTVKELKKNVIFVNGKNITELKLFRTKINDNDEITIMSPVSGG